MGTRDQCVSSILSILFSHGAVLFLFMALPLPDMFYLSLAIEHKLFNCRDISFNASGFPSTLHVSYTLNELNLLTLVCGMWERKKLAICICAIITQAYLAFCFFALFLKIYFIFVKGRVARELVLGSITRISYF